MSGMSPEEVAELHVVQAKTVMDVRLNALLKLCQARSLDYVGPAEPGQEDWRPDQIRAAVWSEVSTLLERIIEGRP